MSLNSTFHKTFEKHWISGYDDYRYINTFLNFEL